MKKLALWQLIYALLLSSGGVIGYVKSGSSISLFAGETFATVICLCSILLFQKKQLGMYLALLVTILLSSLFLYRFILTEKWMPAGILGILSFVVLFLTVYTIFQQRKNQALKPE